MLMVVLTLELVEFTESICPNNIDGFNLTWLSLPKLASCPCTPWRTFLRLKSRQHCLVCQEGS